MVGLFWGTKLTQLNPNLNIPITASSFPSTSSLIAKSTIFLILPSSSPLPNSLSVPILPLTSSITITPNEYTSHLGLDFTFFSDSGAWYADPRLTDGLPPLPSWFSRLGVDLWLPKFRAELEANAILDLPERSLSRPRSAIKGSISAFKRMLEGLRLPWTCFFSWMKASPRAIPLAIFNRTSNDRWLWEEDDELGFPK